MSKKINTIPFDRKKVPPKQNIIVMPFMWLYCYIATKKYHLKINRVNMEGLKPPFLVLGTHHSFMDFLVTPLALFPKTANYISELEGFEYYGEWKYRQIGCLGTRKFVDDLALVKNMKRVVDRGGIMVFYPEARYANVGTTAVIPESVGKLAKMLKVPLVIINMKGNYLQSPIWNLTPRKGVRLEANITKVYTAEELKKASIEEVNETIHKYLSYDEYKWQYETKQQITYGKRAEGLEKPLYQCRDCKQEFSMIGKGSELICSKCGAAYNMDEYGRLSKDTEYVHIPDWYEWEREQVKKEVDEGRYFLDMDVHIESLPNAVNFIDLGKGHLIHKEDGFYLTFTDYGEEKEKTMFVPTNTLLSVHTEYDYRGKGMCITLSTLDNTYFIYPLEEGFNPTKIQFAAEYLFDLYKQNVSVHKKMK